MKSVQDCQKILSSETSNVFDKYTCLSMLRTHGTDEAATALEESYHFLGTSELCKHDVMYCMGQMRRSNSLNFLLAHLNDTTEYPIVRHEAAEALSNFFDLKDQILKVYQSLLENESNMSEILKSTLIVAKEKMLTYSTATKFGKKYLGTIEPAEPLNREEIIELVKNIFGSDVETEIKENEQNFWEFVNKLALTSIEKLGEYNKHRVAYFLRDQCSEKGSKDALKILENLMRRENWGVTTALLRHEVAFIFGQIYDIAKESGVLLEQVCDDNEESPIVRHEVIMALEDITNSKEKLKKYLNHENQVIRESAEVALHA